MIDALQPGAAPAFAIAAAVRSGEVTVAAVIDAALERIALHDSAINAFIALIPERARARSRQLDALHRSGAPFGPLAGVPFGVKAMIDVAGITTTAGSAIYRDAPASARDADVVRALEAAGAVCVGALNMDEFGMGGTTENSCFGPTRNPHDLSRTPGGSSGGAAAALAAGIVPLTVGGDGLGSIRLPASLCGVFGLRPTRGVVSDIGVLGAGGSISTLGPMARNVNDLALTHRVLCGDTDAHRRGGDALTAGIAGLRLGIAAGYFGENMDSDARDAVERVAKALSITRSVAFPEPRRARSAAIVINAAESATDKLHLLRTRLDGFDPGTADRFLAHALLPAQWYLQAQRFRAWHNAQVREMFADVDVLLMPATPCAAPPIGTATLQIDGVDVPTGPTLGLFTQPLAATDCPSLSVPVGRSGQLPIGVQLFAPPHREEWLFRVAARLEEIGVATAPVASAAY